MRQLKLVGIAALVALTALAIGYLWGARGRWAAQEQLEAARRQLTLSEARRHALTGQVLLARLNFGDAAGHFESARAAAESARAHFERAGLTAPAQDAAAAVQSLEVARGLAAKVDQAAAGKASEAVAALDRASAALPPPPL
jgi:hypothetical protein